MPLKQRAALPIRVAIIEDDPMRIAGFHSILDSHRHLRVSSFHLSGLNNARDFDIALVRLNPNAKLTDVIQVLQVRQPGSRVIVTSPSESDESVLNALSCGAKGYVNETSPATDFVQAIHVVHEGMIWASRRVLGAFIEQCGRFNKLFTGHIEFTSREKQVLELLVRGCPNKEIAASLGIETRTVKAHISTLMRKVGVRNRIALSSHALNRCLVVPN